MSSLKAARADNYYYPKDYDHVGGSLNKFQKSHPLGVRAKKIDEGIIVVRYETPFHVKCKKCEKMIGKGVRFNAEKKKVGNYYSSSIWEFTMTCPNCKNKIVCRTDPENSQYVYKEGAYRILATEEASEGQFIPSIKEKEELSNPFLQLENQVQDVQKAQKLQPVIEDLQELQDTRYKDDFEIKLKLCRKFKDEKKQYQLQEEKKKEKKNFGLKLATPQTEDLRIAQQTKFKNISQPKQNLIKSRQKIIAEDVFLNNHNKVEKQNSIAGSKKIKISNDKSILTKQQQEKAQQMEKLKQKLLKLPRSTQQALKQNIQQQQKINTNFTSFKTKK